MIREDFGKDWTVRRMDSEEPPKQVNLPHDAMLREPRSAESRGGKNIGFFSGGDYEYVKHFLLPKEREGERIFLVFEAIYHNSEVTINGHLAGGRPNGYSQVVVDGTPYLKAGEENTVRVLARNADQPNSRWYSGTGIFRPVWLLHAGGGFIPAYGLKVKTEALDPEAKTCTLQLSARTSAPGEVDFAVFDPEGQEVTRAAALSGKTIDGIYEARTEVALTGVRPWSLTSPVLYTLRADFDKDTSKTSFGIRTLSWDRKQGFCLNGKRVLLKGACIHSDNQLLGAVSVPEAEERRVRLLQSLGYNAIRSAHNPASDALLSACDRLGMLVMDEYTDCWYIHKNRYDYAAHVEEWYKRDLSDLVDKDYNHPCVVLYSTGNEVAETGEKRGIHLTRAMTDVLHRLDDTRPVTCGVNIFFNLLYSLGFGVYSDEKAEKAMEAGAKKKSVGSEFYNDLAGILGDRFMKFGATLHGSGVKTRGAYAQMDIAGYNYGIDRYEKDLKHYPKRLILGSETFCCDAYRFMELAKKNPGIVGDFVWAGQDYLGEAGVGAWEYEDYAPKDGPEWGWLSAGSGRIDLVGNTGGEALYTRVAIGEEPGPYLAVVPVYEEGPHSPSAWKMTNAMESWSWPGCTGRKARVEVYARAASAVLSLNGRVVGRKRFTHDCRVVFTLPYEDGILSCTTFTEKGEKIGTCTLRSAGEETRLSLLPEEKICREGRLFYVRLRYTDETGTWKPMERHRIRVQVANGELVALGNACPYNREGFLKDSTKTYYGNALAILKPTGGGNLILTASDGERTERMEWPVEEK